MKWIISTVAAAALGLALVSSAAADDRDRVSLSSASALIGQQLTLVIDVYTPRGATLEIDPGARSWNGIEVVRLASASTRVGGDSTLHHLQIVVAAFALGDVSFAPGVNVVQGKDVVPRALPSASLKVMPTLPPDDPGALTPLPAPRPIDGAESRLLRPALAASVLLGAALVAAGLAFALRALLARKRTPPLVPVAALGVPDLAGVESIIHTDPANAYRTLASDVRRVLSRRYGIPAAALTADEIALRMEAEGLDRWQTRLVSGLLDECDAVIYAGYRPATERRLSDLNMAREIVEAGS